MAMFKIRRLLHALGGGRIGSGSNYTDISTTGYQTMAGTARTYREVWIPAAQFGVYSSSGMTACAIHSACGNVALMNKSNVVSGSIFSGSQAACMLIPVLTPVGASEVVGASMIYATTVLPKPLDADTSGCLNVRVIWTWMDPPPLTSNSCFSFKAGMGYIRTGSSFRTAASVGATASYGATNASSYYETSLGNLPSWGSTDLAGVFTLGVDATVAASNTGGSAWGILGAKMRYVANSLGTQTS